MMSLVKSCKTISGGIFGASGFLLKCLRNLITFELFIGCDHRNNKMLQFWYAYVSDDEEDK